MSKDLNIAILLDYYGSFLTEKQYDALDLYYNQDFSLAEIAENDDISRQGVRDSIKRGEKLLLEMEEKLHLLQITEYIGRLSDKIDEAETLASSSEQTKNISEIKNLLAQIQNLI